MVSLSFRKPVKAAMPRRVMVVEDDATLGPAIIETLTKNGFDDVTICPTARCTLGKLRDGSFDAIVLDSHLADSEEGWEVAELVNALGDNRTRIVFQTDAPEKIPARLKLLGPVLTKPYNPQVLVEALKEKQRPGLLALLKRSRA